MNIVESQFEVLKAACSTATLTRLPSGAYLVCIPGYVLPAGWSKPTVEVKFIAPVGFPVARPDCFWADHDLRLAAGTVPQNSGGNALPEQGTPQWWFSWHVQAWNPNRDTLLTYFHVIERRLAEVR